VKRLASVLALVAGVAITSSAAAQVTISNGISGDGEWQVAALSGGGADTGNIDPTGATALENVIYQYNFFVDPGTNGGGIDLESTTSTAVHTIGTNVVQSSGSFTGPNGTINWTAVGSIGAGSPVYQTTLSFSSTSQFGAVRVMGYLDEDVPSGSGNDNLVLVGTPGTSGFQLLTVDSVANVGVAQTAGFSTATNATYVGWAARPYDDLEIAITGSGQTFSVPGVVTGLASTTDARYPGATVYGPDDITTAFAFDLSPTATSASIVFALGGSPSGQALPTPTPTTPVVGATATPTPTPITQPSTSTAIPALDRRGLALLTLILASLGLVLTRRLMK
jgi:hypothetical protein